MKFLLLGAILALSCILSYLIVKQVRLRALASNRLDIPNDRSSHHVPTPRGGGLGICVATLGVFLIAYRFFFLDTPLSTAAFYYVAAVLIATTAWFDDRQTLPALLRLAAYAGAVILFIAGVGVVNAVHLPTIVNILTFSPLLAALLTFLWLLGFVNAYNFMDGIDGLAGTQALIAASAWCLLFLSEGLWTLALLSGLIAATSLGFLFLNFPPAKIFMGDVGSTFLGFTLAALPVLAFQQLHDPRLFVASVVILVPFLFDTGFTLVRRALKGENVLKAHRSHLYQRLVIAGHSHARVTALYAGLALVSVLGGLLYYIGSETLEIVVLVVMLALHLGLLFSVRSVENRRRVHQRLSSAPPNTEISG